jgi:hypothetical protein
MSNNASLVNGIKLAAFLGLLIGILNFFVVATLVDNVSIWLRWALIFWYITFGIIIAITGIFVRHPIFKFPLKWQVRSAFVGGWLNFTVTFFNYEHFSTYIANSIMSGFVSSPFWFVLDGIVWGLLIGWIVTKMAGDGIDAVHGSEDVMKP